LTTGQEENGNDDNQKKTKTGKPKIEKSRDQKNAPTRRNEPQGVVTVENEVGKRRKGTDGNHDKKSKKSKKKTPQAKANLKGFKEKKGSGNRTRNTHHRNPQTNL